MAYFRYAVLAMLFSLVFLAGCGSSLKKAMRDPVAQSGTSSEELWYQYGGARVAYTAVTRPKQLYAGYSAVRDPALHGQAPATTQEKPPPRKRSKPKAAAVAPRDPNCPPCPPANAAATVPQSTSSQASPAFSAPAQSVAGSVPPPPTLAPGSANAAAPLPSPPATPLPSMPAATPAPAAPGAPGI